MPASVPFQFQFQTCGLIFHTGLVGPYLYIRKWLWPSFPGTKNGGSPDYVVGVCGLVILFYLGQGPESSSVLCARMSACCGEGCDPVHIYLEVSPIKLKKGLLLNRDVQGCTFKKRCVCVSKRGQMVKRLVCIESRVESLDRKSLLCNAKSLKGVVCPVTLDYTCC